MFFFAGLFVNEMHARRFATGIDRDFAHHGIGDDVEITREQSWRDQYGGGLKIRANRATATTGCSVKTCGTTVERLGEDRHA